MEEKIPDWQILASLMTQSLLSELQLGKIAEAHQPTIDKLKKFDPLNTAATFGALLTVPELMTNGTRLEALVHLALAFGQVDRKPTSELVKGAFSALGRGVCGRVEDPAEDLFVTLVRTTRGPFRVIEGVWESAGFYLQRVIGVIEGMPAGSGYDELRESVYALLNLSDLVCERAGLSRYHVGGEMPAKSVPPALLRDLDDFRSRVRFTDRELRDAGIAISTIAPFAFIPGDREGLLGETLGHTQLERFPVAHRNGEFFLVLPTAVSLAIRRFVFERMDDAGMRQAMLAGLALEYAELFKGAPLLGGAKCDEIEFRQTESGIFGGVMIDIDRGRYLHLLFVVDQLDGFEIDTFAGSNPDPLSAADDLDVFIDHAVDLAKSNSDFQSGITLIVGCGFGRQVGHALNNVQRPNWKIETVGAPDLYTLCWAPDFKPTSFWRILEAQAALERHGLYLHNVNGLLNLVAWARSLKGHLVPHGELPDDFVEPGVGSFLMVNQNSLLALRQQVAKVWDPHMQRDVRGHWVSVRREGNSLFEEDVKKPVYASEEGLAGVYETPTRSWWSEVECPDHVEGLGYERWKTSTVWMTRAVPVLEEVFSSLPEGPLRWLTVYEGTLSDISASEAPIGYDAAVEELRVTASVERREITVRASRTYELAHVNSENYGERALVAGLVDGAAMLAERSLSRNEREEIVDRIVPSGLARQQHAFTNPTLRDHVQSSLPRHVTLIDPVDDATSRLGLGWKVREREAGAWVNGKAHTIGFLNALVSVLQTELIADLHQFDRTTLLHMILQNHEAAAIDRDHWHRTAGAVVALHDDKTATREAISRHEFKLNAVFQTSRILVEFAVCECPVEGGRRAGTMDLSRLMVKASDLFNIGGWSDAIRWDVMEPRLRITPMGDVHANWNFVDQIIEPFSLAAADVRIDDAIKSYPKNLKKDQAPVSLAESFEPDFGAAIQEEYGASLDEVRTFVEFVEDLGIRAQRAVITLPRSRLLNVDTEMGTLDKTAALRIVERLTFKTRSRWEDTPEGFEDRDRFPWRFRRQLTILRRPLLQIDHKPDPTIIMAPAIVRDAFVYSVGGLYEGAFPDYQLRPAMRRWAGRKADARGRKFAEDVSKRLRDLGWQVELEVRVTKLLRESFERDYGDVDVLAWDPTTKRVLIIECKDVQYKKTFGEVAEQLADFRGELRPNGKPDYLLLHLNRIELISSRLKAVSDYLGWDEVGAVESHLVFRNPVPMTFALGRLLERVSVSLITDLSAP